MIESAATLAGLDDVDYGVKYVEPELTFRDRVALEFYVLARRAGRVVGFDAARTRNGLFRGIIEAVYDELEFLQALNDPRGIYYHCFCALP